MTPAEFRKQVKHRLIELDMTQTELIRRVKEKTGLYLDSSYMSKIFTGRSAPPKIIGAIQEILELPEE